jgi:hypothetical protein
MNGQHGMDNNTGKAGNGAADHRQDPDQEAVLGAVLQDFRASVHAWSEATYQSRIEATYSSRALVLSPVPRRTFAQRSLGWALSLVLTAGVATAGVHELHQRELAKQAALREAEHQRQLAFEQHAREVDELLAKVDSAVSREVPSAMEPLATLMVEDETQ